MKVRNIKWNLEYGVSRKRNGFYISLFLLYIFIFPHIPINHDLLSDPRELDVFYITYMVTELFSQFARYFRKKSLKIPCKKHCHCN